MNYKNVVFICTGNFYRSRFSEIVFNALAEQQGLQWRATSRGLKAWLAANEGPISEFAAYRLTAMGIPFDLERFPKQLSEPDFEHADRVVALKRAEHYAMMQELFPRWADRIEYWHIHDLDCATADAALPLCVAGVKYFVKTLLAEQEASSRQQRAA